MSSGDCVCRLFVPALVPGPLDLTGDQAHHAATVLRVRPEDQVSLFDGRGNEASARIVRTQKKRLELIVGPVSHTPQDMDYLLTVAVAMPRTHRQGYLVEKLTELGVQAIWPVIAARSVVRPKADAVEKWEARAIEACKQSERVWMPVIRPPSRLPALLEEISDFPAAVVPDPNASESFSTHWIPGHIGRPARVIACIGPEGGWEADELDALVAAGASPVKLGSTILRTETAAVAIAAWYCLGGTDL